MLVKHPVQSEHAVDMMGDHQLGASVVDEHPAQIVDEVAQTANHQEPLAVGRPPFRVVKRGVDQKALIDPDERGDRPVPEAEYAAAILATLRRQNGPQQLVGQGPDDGADGDREPGAVFHVNPQIVHFSGVGIRHFKIETRRIFVSHSDMFRDRNGQIDSIC